MKIFYIITSVILLLTARVSGQNRFAPTPDQEIKNVKFYPNPAISVINFDFQKKYDKTYLLQIYNFLGKKVYEAPATDQKAVVNLSDFFRGIYIFQLKDQSGKIIESGKFQVSK